MTFEAEKLSELLDTSNASPFLAVVGSEQFLDELRGTCETTPFFWADHRLCVRHLEGQRMTDKGTLMAEFEAALQIQYLGNDWDSLDDWLGSLEWLNPGAGYVLLISHAENVLEKQPDEMAVLKRVLADNAMGWSTPAREGATRGRPAVPFHVVLASHSLEGISAVWGDEIKLMMQA